MSYPVDFASHDGVLDVNLSFRNFLDAAGQMRYCYLSDDGNQSPTLRVHPGDLLVLHLRNNVTLRSQRNAADEAIMADACASRTMSEAATNLHFHGLTIPPICHQDDTLRTLIEPKDPSFEYRIRIPRDQVPGLYWYHPHAHGLSEAQVLGGASGALIVEGIERANRLVTGLPERVIVIRDQKVASPLVDPKKPGKDLSLNFVPVPYPDYPPASIKMKPGERQLWRVLNASAITYLNLAVLFGHTPQQLGLVAIDGVPMNTPQGRSPPLTWVNHIGVPPGARVEFVMTGPPAGVQGLFVTRTVDTGQGGENDPNRALASLIAAGDAPEPQSKLPVSSTPLPTPARPWLGDVRPVRVRRFYFSEKLENPKDPNSATAFYITEDGRTPAPFDPQATAPNIVVQQGDVEDWIIENRSTELHAFHIHQIHFMLMDWTGMPVNEPFLRDTVNVPYYSDRMLQYPSVRLRMDFRDPNTIGTFVYHCHLLEHEDGGMMGTIRVEAAHAPAVSAKLESEPVTN